MWQEAAAPIPTEGNVELSGATAGFSKYRSKVPGQVDVVVVAPGDFPACPICFEPDPDVAEHVPPESLGGRVMTTTCSRCNHDFGIAEDQLRSYLDLEVQVDTRATDGTVQGRRSATVALRSVGGEPGIAVIRSANPEFRDVVNSGSSGLSVKPVDMTLVIAATLKHAYLAACLHQRKVPQSDAVDLVRAVLVAARERSRDRTALINALSRIPWPTAPGWIEGDNTYPVLLVDPGENGPVGVCFRRRV